jgi:hypothetical protein
VDRSDFHFGGNIFMALHAQFGQTFHQNKLLRKSVPFVAGLAVRERFVNVFQPGLVLEILVAINAFFSLRPGIRRPVCDHQD